MHAPIMRNPPRSSASLGHTPYRRTLPAEISRRPADAPRERSVIGIQKICCALLLPLPATLLIANGETALGAFVTSVLSLVPAALNARSAVMDATGNRFASGIDALLYFLASILSLVVAGTIASPGDSKLFRLSYSGFSGESDIAPSYLALVWCFSLATLPILFADRPSPTAKPHRLNRRTALALGFLGSIGLGLSLTVSRYEVFSTRGETGGNGINSLLYWSAAVFVAYIVLLYRRSDSTAYLLAAAAMSAGLLATGNRSPIALLGLALVVRVVASRRARAMLLVGLCLPVGLVVFSYQSIWRSLVSKGLPSGPFDVFGLMFANPLQEFLRLGLDTVDGHSLVASLLDSGFSPQWLDPVLAIANFIPRQVWTDKPTLLGSTIGHDFLGMTAGGIFLSGPGYFSLVSGSLLAGSLLFVLLVLVAKCVSSAAKAHPIVICAAYYLVVRIAIAGDAFDIFLAAQIVVIFGLATLIGKLLPQSRIRDESAGNRAQSSTRGHGRFHRSRNLALKGNID